QPQSQAASAQQVKKKSGFQITSVTSAQINVSGNNSLADDTESYDDMDESHTEDLSSSDMLDVSVSRATDTGVPERSSSDETLNSLHGVDTPGMVSPNEPLRPHSVGQGSQQNTSMVNGAVHHHHYYLQQQNQPHHHLSDSLGGGESSVAALPVAPVRSSSPSVASRAANSQTQRPSMLESCEPLPAVVGAVADPQLNISNVSAAAAVPPPGPAGLDNVAATGHAASVGGGTGPSAAALSTQSQHTQTATGSRFRVVKLDTNSEPFRKGRWTCTDYYEKEVPHATTSEAPKSVEGLAQTAPVTYVSPHEVVGGAYLQQHVAPAALPTAPPQTGVNQPPAVVPQQLPYTLDPQPAQPQGGYSAPQLHAGVIGQGGVRQPDFIQPTAPFQTQVQPPLPHVQMEISISPVPGITAPTSFTQQGLVAPPGQASFLGPPKTLPTQPQPQAQPPSTARFPAALAHGTHYTPLTALQADLQPLLTHGATLPQVPGFTSQILSFTAAKYIHRLITERTQLKNARPTALGATICSTPPPPPLSPEGPRVGLQRNAVERPLTGHAIVKIPEASSAITQSRVPVRSAAPKRSSQLQIPSSRNVQQPLCHSHTNTLPLYCTPAVSLPSPLQTGLYYVSPLCNGDSLPSYILFSVAVENTPQNLLTKSVTIVSGLLCVSSLRKLQNSLSVFLLIYGLKSTDEAGVPSARLGPSCRVAIYITTEVHTLALSRPRPPLLVGLPYANLRQLRGRQVTLQTSLGSSPGAPPPLLQSGHAQPARIMLMSPPSAPIARLLALPPPPHPHASSREGAAEPQPARSLFVCSVPAVSSAGAGSMNARCYAVAMDLGVCQDLVKSHLMYAVREEVEVLKEQIKELIERNTQLEQENNLLKNLASPEQMAQFQAQVQTGGSPTGTAQPPVPGPVPVGTGQAPPPSQSSGTSA
uniref:TSC22 domain family protein 1 n=1 Tax=Gasterosteus aculeatus TaxID=69293 RepID=G3PKL1_GASAC